MNLRSDCYLRGNKDHQRGQDLVCAIALRVAHARRKHPHFAGNDAEAMDVIGEEFRELCQAVECESWQRQQDEALAGHDKLHRQPKASCVHRTKCCWLLRRYGVETANLVAYVPTVLRSMREICETLGVGEKTVKAWVGKGAPIAVEGGGYKARYSTELARLQIWRELKYKVCPDVRQAKFPDG